MSDLERNDGERVSRQVAAERLADLAYALTAGGRLELMVDGERLSVPLADDVLLARELKAGADHVELELVLRWTNGDNDDPAL
ncbi:MAG TPA: hypothetical protein VMT10_08830 [Solirubrobacteraceae bacterium]|nr:hypothetical protein [Solirubrobacteraceae bacterium]